MNCNCCNCSNNNSISCEDEKHSKIKIYGTLVNVTLDNTLDDANCAADNQDYDTGHNDALAYAYQIHDGRFRADDENLPAHERFQDAINRRVTNIDFDPDTNITTIEGDTHIENLYIKKGDQWVKIEDANSYDDAWLKDIIGTTPEGEQASYTLLQNDFPGIETGDIIAYIRQLKAEIDSLKIRVTNLENGGSANTCYWKVDNDNYLSPNNEAIGATCQGVRGPGFYDTTVS